MISLIPGACPSGLVFSPDVCSEAGTAWELVSQSRQNHWNIVPTSKIIFSRRGRGALKGILPPCCTTFENLDTHFPLCRSGASQRLTDLTRCPEPKRPLPNKWLRCSQKCSPFGGNKKYACPLLISIIFCNDRRSPEHLWYDASFVPRSVF